VEKSSSNITVSQKMSESLTLLLCIIGLTLNPSRLGFGLSPPSSAGFEVGYIITEN